MLSCCMSSLLILYSFIFSSRKLSSLYKKSFSTHGIVAGFISLNLVATVNFIKIWILLGLRSCILPSVMLANIYLSYYEQGWTAQS